MTILQQTQSMRMAVRVWTPRCMMVYAMTLGVGGCSLDGLVKVDDPEAASVIDQGHVKSLSGAIGTYYSAIGTTAFAISQLSVDVGTMTDELTANPTGATGGFDGILDARYSGTDEGLRRQSVYRALQTARVQSGQSAELLLRFGTEREHPYVGHAYALQGYAELMLAEVMCSGIPLTIVPFDGKITYTKGFTTTEILRRAIAHFDTALHYASDSLEIATFARVGRGRAYLSLKLYDSAAASVTDVPTTAKYIIQYSATVTGAGFWTTSATVTNAYRITNKEGGNGIVWAAPTPALQDPRLPLSRSGVNFTNPIRQQKFTSATVNVTVASGVEARLIEAEARLQPSSANGSDWLTRINEARHTQSGLVDTTDPGTAEGRISLLFRERAFWFYLDGHRLGDMRRLVRNYDYFSSLVFPAGSYQGNTASQIYVYGNEVVFVPDLNEEKQNPLYQGCINRAA